MDNSYFIIEQYYDCIEVEEFAGHEWGKAYARIQELRKDKCEGMKVTVLRGMLIEKFEVKNEE